MTERVTGYDAVAKSILDKAIELNFLGTDPFDALNSRILKPILPVSKKLRLAVTQIVKNSPVNLRKILLIPPGHNPKGLALFLSGLGYKKKMVKENSNSDDIATMEYLEKLILCIASREDGSPVFTHDRALNQKVSVEDVDAAGLIAWGYNFPWQSRTSYKKAWYPTVVATSYVLDAFHDSDSKYFPAVAKAAAMFTHKCIPYRKDKNGIIFSYAPNNDAKVYNASLFAAKILARAASMHDAVSANNSRLYMDLALEACNYVIDKQRDDGSWFYGEADHWQWIDNLHTGFVLETLQDISDILGISSYKTAILRGLDYYSKNLISDDGSAKYYQNSVYPMDSHSYAQAIITLLRFGCIDKAEVTLSKAMEHLWDSKRTGFIFRRYRYVTNRQFHLRWSQAWMYRALCYYLYSQATTK